MINLVKKIIYFPQVLLQQTLLFVTGIMIYLKCAEDFRISLLHHRMVLRMIKGEVLACYYDVSNLSREEVKDMYSELKEKIESDKKLLEEEYK